MIRNFRFLLLSLLIVLTIQMVQAQTVIINTPSTDVVPEKKVYVEFDFLGHLSSYQTGGFQTYIPRVVYGAGKGVEVGLNATWSKAATPNQPVELQPNVKWQFYNNEKKGIAMSGGGMLFTTVANRTGTDSFGMMYSNISKKVSPKEAGPPLPQSSHGAVGRWAVGQFTGGLHAADFNPGGCCGSRCRRHPGQS